MSKKNKSATHNTIVTNLSDDTPLAVKLCQESYQAFQHEVLTVVWDGRSTYWRERIHIECKQYLKAARGLLADVDLYPLYQKMIDHDETPHQVDGYYRMMMAALAEAKAREDK